MGLVGIAAMQSIPSVADGRATWLQVTQRSLLEAYRLEHETSAIGVNGINLAPIPLSR